MTDPAEYDGDAAFKSCFGGRILLFRPDKSYPELFPGVAAHRMVFRDGVTIAVDAMDRAAFLRRYGREQTHENVWFADTFQVLLDKDALLPNIGRSEETQTLFDQVPTQADFCRACTEFWWVMKTFAEYTRTHALPAAMFCLNDPVRGLLNRMLRWQLRLRAGGPVDMGVLDGNLEKLLEKEEFLLYEKTYPDAAYAHIWEAFDAVAALWHRAACAVADFCGFAYAQETEDAMLEFLRELRNEKE